MEINSSVTLQIKHAGLVSDFTRWNLLNNSVRNWDDNYNPIDGLQWTGSAENLLNLEYWRNLQKVAPKIILDVGEICGYTDFNYVVLPYIGSNFLGYYGVYALTNNQTILQHIGDLEFNVRSTQINSYYYYYPYGTVSFYFSAIPDENYVPVDHDLVESITINGIDYEYVGITNSLDHSWSNSNNTNIIMGTDHRNPNVNDDAWNIVNWNYYSIENITFYPGKEPNPDSGGLTPD